MKDFFVKFHSGQNISLRLLHYPACDSSEVQDSQLGAGAHTDYGLTTFLFQDSVGGLEICDKNGDWQEIKPDKSVVLINSGDLLERWTNGKYRSTLHRVKPMTRGKDRFSIAFFVDPDSDTEIKVLESCIDAGTPRKFSDINAGEYIQGKLENSHVDFQKRGLYRWRRERDSNPGRVEYLSPILSIKSVTVTKKAPFLSML